MSTAARCSMCPPHDLCTPPLHNLLVCCGPKTDSRCPREQWQASHSINEGEAHD